MSDLLERAEALVAKWQSRMHLDAYLIKVVLDQECDAPARFTVPAYEQQVLITLRPSVCADLRETYPVLADLTDEQLIEMAVVHELSHVLTVGEWQAMNRYLDWLIGKKDQAGFFADMHSAWLDLDEAIARRTTRILLDADRGAWAPVGIPAHDLGDLTALRERFKQPSAPVAVNGGTTTYKE